MNLFKDIIPSITTTGVSVLYSESDYSSYVPFVVNRALSYHIDCVFFANEINLYPSAEKEFQYTYLLGSIKKYKRPYSPWQKKEHIEDLGLIKEYFGYSDQKALTALSILTSKQIEEIRNKMDKGGL